MKQPKHNAKRTAKAATSKKTARQRPAAAAISMQAELLPESTKLAPQQVRIVRAFAAFWAAMALFGLAWAAWFTLAEPGFRTMHHEPRGALAAIIAVPSVLILILSYYIFTAEVRQQYRLFITLLGLLVCMLLLAVPLAALAVVIITGAILYYGTRDLSRRL